MRGQQRWWRPGWGCGRRAYVIPEGGSNALGAFGYVQMVGEVVGQLAAMGEQVDYLVTAVGSGGTLAGLALGKLLYGFPGRILGFNVSANAELFRRRVREIVAEAVQRYGLRVEPEEAEFEVIDGYVGLGYAQSQPKEIAFIRQVAESEGIVLDPVYTGKALYGLVDQIRQGRFRPEEKVLFVHTGGIFGLFVERLREFWD